MRTKMKMNVKLWTLVLPCVFVLTTPGFAEEKKANATQKTTEDSKEKPPTKEELFSAQNISKLSETYGHLIQKGLDNPVLKLDFDGVIRGMQDGKAGKPSPMTEQEYEESINQLQEFAYQDLASRNLQEAEKFLKDNSKKEGVKELEPGKLQYLTLKEGTGEVVTEEMRPMIKYSGQYLDGTVFGSSDTGSGPIAISLKQTIPGFRKGVLGMKVGEKRRIFIHPELGYGTSGQLLPNALLIFEIEVTEVKPEPKETSSNEEDASADDMSLAAENLFPDELDERDDFDDEDDEDDADEESDEDDDLADLDPDTRDSIETPDNDLEQNDLKQLNDSDKSEQNRAERAKEKARLQRAREEKVKQQQQLEEKQQKQQDAQKKQQAQPQSVARAEQLEKKDDLDTKKPVQTKNKQVQGKPVQGKPAQDKTAQDKSAQSTQKTQNTPAKTTAK